MKTEQLAELVDEGIALEKQIKESGKQLDAIKAELQAAAIEEMDNKNLKWLQIFGKNGHFNVSQKEKFEIDDYPALIAVLGEKAQAKIAREEKIKYTTEARFKAALIALFRGDYADAEEGYTLDDILRGLDLDDKTIKAVKKKLKGDYLKDKKLLESVGVTGECEEELDAIRLLKNAELVQRFFGGLDAEQLEQIKKAVFVEDSVGVGLEYEQ